MYYMKFKLGSDVLYGIQVLYLGERLRGNLFLEIPRHADRRMRIEVQTLPVYCTVSRSSGEAMVSTSLLHAWSPVCRDLFVVGTQDPPRHPQTQHAPAACPLRVLTSAPPYDSIGRRAAWDDNILVVWRVPLASPTSRGE